MKVVTVLGTRPEIIRLSLVIPLLDRHCEHVLVNTGQNSDPKLSEMFFQDLGVRRPDHDLGVRAASFAEQVGKILVGAERVLVDERPDRVLILGDTNSGLAAYVAKRLGIPVYHMEAGNRCYDDRVPEEVNRRVIDHASDVLMPYTERSRANLLREGIPGERVFVTGNPIYEVLRSYDAQIARSDVAARLGLERGRYMLVTLHRAENVDDETRLRSFMTAFDQVQRAHDVPIVCSVHPRLRDRLSRARLGPSNDKLVLLEPLNFFDFVHLEKHAMCVLSDSGTVQEECCIFNVPNVTLRDVTERPETVECGSNILSGSDPQQIATAIALALARQGDWHVPPEYTADRVSHTVARIVLGYRRC